MSLLASLLLGATTAQAVLPEALGPEREGMLPAGAETSLQEALPTSSAATEVGRVKRPMNMELGFRGRYLFLPDSVMDIWYFNSDDPGANPYERPKVRAYSVGMELMLKPQPTNWIFYAEYMGNNVQDGYWDDVESPADHDDGDWIVFDNFSMLVLGANYGHEVPITSVEKPVWLSMVFGGGLGFGVIMGDLTRWHAGGNADVKDAECLPESAAYERKDSCVVDGVVRIPPVVPMVDINYSLRLNLGDRASVRFDAGLHNLIYLGGAFGGVF